MEISDMLSPDIRVLFIVLLFEFVRAEAILEFRWCVASNYKPYATTLDT